MDFSMDRIRQTLGLLNKHIYSEKQRVSGWRFCECGYKTDNTIPDKNGPDFRTFGDEDRWGKEPDSHAWFCNNIVVP